MKKYKSKDNSVTVSDYKSTNETNYHARLQILGDNLRKHPKLFDLAYVLGLSVIMLFVVYKILPNPQKIYSEASPDTNTAWLGFVPYTISTSGDSASKFYEARVVLRKQSGNKASAVKLHILYDASKVTDLSVEVRDWARGKEPVVLEEFKTQTTGNEGIATITLGSKCTESECYPISKAITPLLTLKFKAQGPSTMRISPDTILTFIGSSDNYFSVDSSGELEIN